MRSPPGSRPTAGCSCPHAMPTLDLRRVRRTDDRSRDIAATLLAPFFANDALGRRTRRRSAAKPSPSMRRCARWRHAGDFVLELFHGPTAAFKDFGARFLAACMRRLPRRRRKTADDPRRHFRRHRRGRGGGVPSRRRISASSSCIRTDAFRRARRISSAASATTCARSASTDRSTIASAWSSTRSATPHCKPMFR